MFSAIILGGLAGAVAGSVFCFRKNVTETTSFPETKTVKANDSTKIYKTAFDQVMEILDTSNDDKTVHFISKIVNEAIIEKQKPQNGRVSLRRLILNSTLATLTTKKFVKWQQHVEDHNTLDALAGLISMNFVTNNPLKDFEVDSLELRHIDDDSIFKNMLHSYKSVGLNPETLRNSALQRKGKKLNIQNKVREFIQNHRDSDFKITRKSLLKFVGHSEIDQAWKFVLDNRAKLEEEFNVTIAKRASGHKFDKGNTAFFTNLFIQKSSVGATGTLFFNARAKIRMDGTIVVQQGSVARTELSNTFDPINTKTGKINPVNGNLRNKLINEGSLMQKDGLLIFTKDVEFSSTSIAGTIVCGARISGHTCWEDEITGQTLKEVIEGEKVAIEI
jgi:hypothetical protein